jgi:hypothetical protein
MATTQIFVELLIIGLGASIWLALFGAAALRYPLDRGFPQLQSSVLIMLTGVVYVVGIVIDRVARLAFGGLERRHRERILPAPPFPAVEAIERLIMIRAAPLAEQIQYNRSRLRICRAWTLNFLLICLAFTCWELRAAVVGPGEWGLFAATVILLALGAAWVTNLLSRDHYTNLRETYEFLVSRLGNVERQSEAGRGNAV